MSAFLTRCLRVAGPPAVQWVVYLLLGLAFLGGFLGTLGMMGVTAFLLFLAIATVAPYILAVAAVCMVAWLVAQAFK